MVANLIFVWLLWKASFKPVTVDIVPLIAAQPPTWTPFDTAFGLSLTEAPPVLDSASFLKFDVYPEPLLRALFMPALFHLSNPPLRIDFGTPTDTKSFNDATKPRIKPHFQMPPQSPPRAPLPPHPQREMHPEELEVVPKDRGLYVTPESVGV